MTMHDRLKRRSEKRYCTRCDDTGRTHSHEWYGPWPDGERRALYRPCPDLTKEWHR